MSRRIATGRRAPAGFTLIELLMGIALASIFALALFGFFFSGLDTARTHESQARAQADGRTAMDRVAREARQAISPDEGVTAPVIALSPTNLEMYVDPSRSPSALTPRPNRVRYRVVSNQLVREYATPVGATPPYAYGSYGRREVLVARLQNGTAPVFRAVTNQGAALPAAPAASQLRDIAQISIRLIIAQKTGKADTTLELNTDVALRNAVRL